MMTTTNEATIVLEDPVGAGLLLKPGVNLHHGLKAFREEYGEPTSLEEDLLILASAIFACDLAFKRGEREDVARSIMLTVPVVNLAAFERVKSELQYALYRLSHDAWDVRFVAREGTPEKTSRFRSNNEGKVLLFSGGLDSFAAAVHFGEKRENIHLVSHITANRVVSQAQERLHKHLTAAYPGRFERSVFRVSGFNRKNIGFPFPTDSAREETQRTRSFLFLSLAGLVARRRGLRDVVMIAENGQMAIHLPLTAARIGAFSTHTAHPAFVSTMSSLLTKLLSADINIENPFLYLTKAEVVREVVEKHPKTLEQAVSCWKASRVSGTHNHCGFCIPCLVRRISIEANGTILREYKRDLLAEDVGALDADDDGRRNLIELGEFVSLFESAPQAFLESEYPDLADSSIDTSKAIAMYQRFAKEARGVFTQYEKVKDLLS